MRQPSSDAVVVSPARTLRNMLVVSAIRATVGMVATLALVGNGAFPLLIPGLMSLFYFVKGKCNATSRNSRIGLCLSSSLWVGSAASFVCHDPSEHSIFFAAVVTSFAVTDIMLASIRLERVS